MSKSNLAPLKHAFKKWSTIEVSWLEWLLKVVFPNFLVTIKNIHNQWNLEILVNLHVPLGEVNSELKEYM